MVIAQLICLILFAVKSGDAISQAPEHEKRVELVVQNFDGRCTDENVSYDFDVDLSAYPEDREKAKTLVLIPYAILPVYVLYLAYFIWYGHRKK